MNRTYRNSATAGNSTDIEYNFLPSETVPDQSMTVRTILERFASGTLSDIGNAPEYSEDNPDLRGLDISQLHDMRKQARENANALQEAIKTEAREKRELKNQQKADEAEIIPE